MSPESSLGKGPPPTRVVYAFKTPIAPSMRLGGTPVPVHAPPEVEFPPETGETFTENALVKARGFLEEPNNGTGRKSP